MMIQRDLKIFKIMGNVDEESDFVLVVGEGGKELLKRSC